jgi:transmembrane sensor
MTDIESGNEREPSRAEEVETRAADWLLAKRASESWTDGDQQALDEWLLESPAHLLSYWRIEETWNRAQRLKALRPPMGIRMSLSGGRTRSHAVGLAMVLALSAVVAAYWLNAFQEPPAKRYATPVGGHLTLALSDGSLIELNTDTILSISNSPAQRSATLIKGEAFFEIKHDAARPFAVRIGDHLVTDLGTKFVVRTEGAKVRVALLEGKARFETESTEASAQSTDMSPGDVVIATRDGMTLHHKTTGELANSVGWRRGVLVFDNTTLAEAARELNRYNLEQVRVVDPAVARLTIGGTFADNDVPALVNTAKQVFGLTVTRRGNDIVISR